RPIAWILRRMVFPLGKDFKGPGDALDQQVANLLLAPSAARDRLTSGLFLPIDGQNKLIEPIGRLEYAMQSMMDAAGAEKKLQTAIKSGAIAAHSREQQIEQAAALNLLDANEIEALRKADQAQREALKVDDFDPAELSRQSVAYTTKDRAKESA
ncbi:MAG: DUF1974 domain-containing protein, partial [Gammaproteobacteria bacterium]|nr:DUF1974 domain-containing protein [Gammaproteobacteria bacterium]